jgi:mono/diheme cytochrome c family protein
VIKLVAFALAVVLALAALVAGYALATGLDARAQPSALETQLARSVRRLAIPTTTRERPNPVASTSATIAEGMAHYADHCASCHANDGSGNTEMGRGLFPKPPDMRLATTQDLTDGELFYIIEHGVRFTGMPGWSTGTDSGAASTWQLVHFIRQLPRLTEQDLEQMQTLTPRSPAEVRQEIEEERFLHGGEVTPPATTTHEHSGAH